MSISELCGAWFAEVFGSVESGWQRCTTRVDVDSFKKFQKFGEKKLSRGHFPKTSNGLVQIDFSLQLLCFKVPDICLPMVAPGKAA